MNHLYAVNTGCRNPCECGVEP